MNNIPKPWQVERYKASFFNAISGAAHMGGSRRKEGYRSGSKSNLPYSAYPFDAVHHDLCSCR